MPYADLQKRQAYHKQYNTVRRAVYYQENKVRMDAAAAASRKRHPEGARIRKQLATYNMTLDEYGNLDDNQNWCCAICKQPPPGRRTLYIDHNHKTGKIRGLLCSRCNIALGFIENDQVLNASRHAYLQRHAIGV